MGMAMPIPMLPADVGESITADNGSNELSMSSWDDTNSNIMFFVPGSKKAKVFIDGDNGMVTKFSKIKSQFGLSSMSLDMPGMDGYLQPQQDFVACIVLRQACLRHSPVKHR
ncbi:hypothetical protein CFC21_070699 [Triticum aestivum]|uniref:Uncharacterized protein n=3 Tax=Triticum TaxID=4564 RepID=A0A9R1AIS8_TRITD|nr:hypothetical protein CFC21_070699 [Triticum aestivum]VAI29412.1 unnamed protein product [Triticum turgidum subsp. durum]